jgi:predicted transcriptional regulator
MEMETKKKEIKRPRINKEDFIKAWATVYNNGGNHNDVAEILGCTQSAVASKSKKLIEEGVNLPDLKKKGSTDVEGLNKLIESLIGE